MFINSLERGLLVRSGCAFSLGSSVGAEWEYDGIEDSALMVDEMEMIRVIPRNATKIAIWSEGSLGSGESHDWGEFGMNSL